MTPLTHSERSAKVLCLHNITRRSRNFRFLFSGNSFSCSLLPISVNNALPQSPERYFHARPPKGRADARRDRRSSRGLQRRLAEDAGPRNFEARALRRLRGHESTHGIHRRIYHAAAIESGVGLGQVATASEGPGYFHAGNSRKR